MSKYQMLIDFLYPFIGDYNREKWEITLYDVENKEFIHNALKAAINTITLKYKYIVLDTGLKYSNVKILDIEL